MKYPSPTKSPATLADTESFKAMVESLKNRQQTEVSRFTIKKPALEKEPEKLPRFRYVQPTASTMPPPVFSNFFSKTQKKKNQFIDLTDAQKEPVTFKKPIPPKRKSLNLDAQQAAGQLSGSPLAESNSIKGSLNIS